MQPGDPQGPYSEPAPVVPVQTPMMAIPQGMKLVTSEPVPLSPPPSNLQMARPSRPWRMYGRIVVLVVFLFLFEQALASGWMVALEGDPLLGSLCIIFAIPIMLVVVAIRRPRVVLLERAVPDSTGRQLHTITSQSGSLQTQFPTRLDRHLMRDNSILDVPASSTVWWIFAATVFCAIVLSVMLYLEIAFLLAVILIIPTVLIGFSIPVMGWWSHSTKRIGLPTRRRDAEAWLMAGILSGLPAIMINSWLFPGIITTMLPNISDDNLFYLTIIISAPVGEEICKAAAIWFFASRIRSPKHGFQIGFTVGLGFAIIENLMYISESSAGVFFSATILIRGIGSIPGHAFWTSLTGAAMGWTIMRTRAATIQSAAEAGHQIRAPEQKPSDWKLVDKNTGAILETPQSTAGGVSVNPSGVQIWTPTQQIITKKPWLTVPLPENIVVGLLLAMLGHATWNGAGILLYLIAVDIDMHWFIYFFLELSLTVLLVAGVLIIGSGLLHSVREAPDGSEVDEYQAQLADMTQQRF
jgi:RsiW-degrading membrane proteinase PrsW (M82 family)